MEIVTESPIYRCEACVKNINTISMIQYTIKNIKEMRELAAKVFDSGKKVICLEGDLGVGKTEFARAFINYAAQQKTKVISPTYNIVQSYDIVNGGKIHHFDLYRLESHSELYDIGFEEALESSSTKGICIIEWPQIAEYELSLVPVKQKVSVKIEIIDEKSRRISIV